MGAANPYGARPATRSVGGLAIALAVLLGLLAAFDLLGIAVELATAGTFAAGERPGITATSDAQGAHYAMIGLHLFGAAVIGILWVIWQHGHATNAKALGKAGGLGTGMAVGGWIIPIAGLVLGPLELGQSARPANEGRTPPLVLLWAVLLAVASGVLVAAIGLTPEEDPVRTSGDRDGMHLAATVAAVGFGAFALAALAALAVVVVVTRKQVAALAANGLA